MQRGSFLDLRQLLHVSLPTIGGEGFFAVAASEAAEKFSPYANLQSASGSLSAVGLPTMLHLSRMCNDNECNYAAIVTSPWNGAQIF